MPKLKQIKSTHARNSQVIKAERLELAKKIEQLRNGLTPEKPSFTTEERANWDKLNKDYDGLEDQLKVAERAESIEAENAKVEDHGIGRDNFLPEELRHLAKKHKREALAEQYGPEARANDQNTAMQAWLRHQSGLELKKRHVLACKRTGLNPTSRNLDIKLANITELHRMQERYRNARQGEQRWGQGAGNNGGFITTPAFVTNLERAMLDYSGVMQVAEIIQTSDGNELRWPMADDTGNKGARLSANTAATTDTSTPWKRKTWYAYKYHSKNILVEQELLEDNAINLASIIPEMLGERIGRIFNDEATTGDGAEQPEGIMTNVTTGTTTASTTAVTASELVTFQHTVDPAYRTNARWMMHDSILAQFRQLKDSQNRFLWMSSLSDGVPDRLLGYPISLNQSMDSALTATKQVAIFGDLSKIKVRRVNSMRMYRLQERYRDQDADAFLAFVRLDSKVLDAGTHPFKQLLMHA